MVPATFKNLVFENKNLLFNEELNRLFHINSLYIMVLYV